MLFRKIIFSHACNYGTASMMLARKSCKQIARDAKGLPMRDTGIVKPEKQPLPETVDRAEFTAAIRKLIATPPIPKAAIPRKRAVKTARPDQAKPRA